jgi:hypothetical protein
MSLRYRGPAPLPSAFKAMLLLHQYGVDRFFVIFQINTSATAHESLAC